MTEELDKLIELCDKHCLTIIRFNLDTDIAIIEDRFGNQVPYRYTYKGEWE